MSDDPERERLAALVERVHASSDWQEIEKLMASPAWGEFWFLRPLRNKRLGIYHWQVWDFRAVWYPGWNELAREAIEKTKSVAHGPTVLEAVRAAIESLSPPQAAEKGT